MTRLPPLVLLMLMATLPACEEALEDDTCGREALLGFLGQPAEVLDTVRFSQPVRVIPHDGVVTLEFNPERVNFRLDPQGTIVDITCG